VGFFDQYELFYRTSQTSPYPHRLNSRFKAIIERHKLKLEGKRVLDIASHDGRWAFAALQAGAAHVTGIEPRQELIDNAHSTFAHYGISADRYAFECGDIFEGILGRQFDVVLCLGFYYHTIRHAELLDLIDRTGAEFVVIDTEVTPTVDEVSVKESSDPRLVYANPYNIQLLADPVDDQQMAWTDSMTRNGKTIVGRPSRAAVAFLADHFGYDSATYDWPAHFAIYPEAAAVMADYREGWRDTFFLDRKQ
jgi:hypothetical protein